MSKLHILAWRVSCSLASAVLVLSVTSCAPSEPREKRALSVDDVDLVSPGVEELIRIEGLSDLNNDPRIECIEYTPTGTHFSKMICRTRAEMAKIKKDSEEALLEAQEDQERIRENNPYNQ